MMTIMDRSVLYQINGLEKPQKISGFLKEKGYSRQNLVVHMYIRSVQADCLFVFAQIYKILPGIPFFF